MAAEQPQNTAPAPEAAHKAQLLQGRLIQVLLPKSAHLSLAGFTDAPWDAAETGSCWPDKGKS